MRAAAGSGIFGLGEVAAPTLPPAAPSVSTDEVQGGAGASGTTVTSVPDGFGYRNDQVEGGRIGTRVGGWREADRERLV